MSSNCAPRCREVRPPRPGAAGRDTDCRSARPGLGSSGPEKIANRIRFADKTDRQPPPNARSRRSTSSVRPRLSMPKFFSSPTPERNLGNSAVLGMQLTRKLAYDGQQLGLARGVIAGWRPGGMISSLHGNRLNNTGGAMLMRINSAPPKRGRPAQAAAAGMTLQPRDSGA